MKIAFLHQPNDPYTEVRIKYFLKRGHEVYSLVFFNKNKQKKIEGLHIIELPPLFISKLYKRIAYCSFIKSFTEQNKIDIFYIVSALNSIYIKSSKAKKTVLELQGSDVILFPDKFPLIKILYKKYWKYADAIIQDSELAKQKISHLLPREVINKTIEIGVNLNVFNPSVPKGIVRKKYKLGNRPIVFHSRSIKKIYNLKTIIASIPNVKNSFPEIIYIFTGNIEHLDTASKHFITANHLEDNVMFCGRLDHEKEMKYFYADADIMVSIPLSDSSPFSVYEAMATKTPVIVSDLPWLNGKFIPDKHLLVTSTKDPKMLASKIIKVLSRGFVLDTEEAFEIIKNKINMEIENKKREDLFIKLLQNSNTKIS